MTNFKKPSPLFVLIFMGFLLQILELFLDSTDRLVTQVSTVKIQEANVLIVGAVFLVIYVFYLIVKDKDDPY